MDRLVNGWIDQSMTNKWMETTYGDKVSQVKLH